MMRGFSKFVSKVSNRINSKFTKDRVVLGIYGNNKDTEILFARIRFFFRKSIIVRLKYRPFLNLFYHALPFPKLYFGFDETQIGNEPFQRLWFNIDPTANPSDAWEYHKLLARYGPKSHETEKQKFLGLIDYLLKKNLSKTYLFATGSSLASAIRMDFSDGYKIVCNTIVKDANLWNHLNPDIIVAGDSLYHFSDADFAKLFRSDLRKRLAETTNTYFIYPLDNYEFVRREFEGFHDRLIGIPVGSHKAVHNNLAENFELPAIGNVLNLLLLPLGCTLSKEVFFWGFDGRAPGDNDFWKNSDQHFYPEHIEALKDAHPAFFEFFVPRGNESKYVNSVHGDVLDQSLQMAERDGFKFSMMHFSYTPALQKRAIYDTKS